MRWSVIEIDEEASRGTASSRHYVYISKIGSGDECERDVNCSLRCCISWRPSDRFSWSTSAMSGVMQTSFRTAQWQRALNSAFNSAIHNAIHNAIHKTVTQAIHGAIDTGAWHCARNCLHRVPAVEPPCRQVPGSQHGCQSFPLKRVCSSPAHRMYR